MAMNTFYNEIKRWKVKELRANLKPMFTIECAKNSFKRDLDNYHAKYIETSSVDPVFHICIGVMTFSYLFVFPEERLHLEHAKEHGYGH